MPADGTFAAISPRWFRQTPLAVLTVALPALAAFGFFSDLTTKVLAGAGALSAALSHALRPHEYVTAYDAGLQLAWKTRISLVFGTINAETADKDLRRAVDLTTFKYGAAGGIRNQRQSSN